MPSRFPAREVPRWKRGGQQAPPVITSVQLRGRHARAYAREVALISAQQPGQGKGKKATANETLAVTGAWRFRRHAVPFAWLAGLLAASGLHAAPHPVLWGLLASVVVPAVMVLFTRHLPAFSRHFTEAWAVLTSLWLPFLAAYGLRPCIVPLLITWAFFLAAWVRRYRWRATTGPPQPQEPESDVVTWGRLADKRRWTGKLTSPEPIPGGGRKWQIELDGIETHIGQVMSEPRAIAAAWGKPQTEAYVEPHPTGIESRGILTILKAGTLEVSREWDGDGFGEDGIARIGRFADSQPARIRAWVPMDGTRHGLIAGASGAGKSALLDLLIWLAITCPIPVVPVILDPQNGQSLPQWRDKLLYAAGVEDCIRMLRGLNAGMMARSRRLASMTWDDGGHKVKGMEFFDPRLTGLPVIMPIVDESPLVLSGGGNVKLAAEAVRLEGEAAKLGRKTGRSEWLVAQVPSLSELGDQALRSMLVGGNVICLRTGDRVSAGMVGLEADPSALPKYFPGGDPTAGLGYVVSIDNRQAPFRTDMVPRQMRHRQVDVPVLDEDFLEAMDGAMGVQGVLLPRGDVPRPEPADDMPEGRRCIDAVRQILADSGKPMERGEIIKWANELAVTVWGREKPFSIRAITDALGKLTDSGMAAKVRDGVYQVAGR